MAVSITMTGTGQNCSITSGSNSIVVSSTTGLVVGATIQGTGIPTGSRIGTISGTTVTMVTATGATSNATVTNTTASLIFSSVWGSVVTISMSASGDIATPLSIYSAGFGVMNDNLGTKHILFPGALGIIWRNMVAGSLFDYQNFTLEFGSGGYWAWSQDSILGELRGGYLVNGTQFIKAAGPTLISNNFKNAQAGGSNMFIDTATGNVTGTFRMNNLRVLYQVGSNTAPFFNTGRMNCIVDNMILDYSVGSGANAGLATAFGTLNNTTIVRANSGLGNPNLGNYATINGLTYSGIFTDSPNHKFSIPNNYVLEGYAPQVLSTQLLGGFQDNTTETYANIDLSSAGWGLNDLKTKYQRYGGNNIINFPRRVTLNFFNSAGAALTGATLYIRSGSTSVINAVQAGNYSANTQALVLGWTSIVASYRVANTIIDTISQVAQIRRYGFIEQSTSYSLNLTSYSQPFFLLTDTSLSGISESTASAITTAGINWTNNTITPTANLTYDQINARIAWELTQTTNSGQADPRTISGSKLSLATGWTLVVNNGITISAGSYLDQWYAPTITLNGTGSIVATYEDSTGTFAKILINGLSTGMVAKLLNGSTTLSSGTSTGSSMFLNYFIPTGGSSISATLYVERATGQANGYNLYTNNLTLGNNGETTTAIMSIDTFYGRSSGRADRANVSVTWNSTTGAPTITLSGNADVISVYDKVLESHATTSNITYNRPTTSDGFTYQFNNAIFTGTGRLTGSKQFFTTGGVSINYDLILNYLNTVNFLPNSWIKVIKSSDDSVLSPFALNTQGKLELNMGTGVDYKVFLKKDGYKPVVVELNSGTGQAVTVNQPAQAYYNGATDISALTSLLDVTNNSGILSIVSVGEMTATSLEVCAIIDYLQKDEDFADVALYAETGDIWEINSQYQNTPNPTYIKIERDSALTNSELTIWDTYFTSSSPNYPDTSITPIQTSTGLWVISNRSAVGEVTIKNEQALAISENASEYVWAKVLENGKTANKNVAQSNNFDAITSIEVQKTN